MDRVIELWKWVGIIGLIVLNHPVLNGQQGGFPRWHFGLDAGLHHSKFYGSDANRTFILLPGIPVIGLSLGYMPSVRWSCDLRVSWQTKKSESTGGIFYALGYAIGEFSVNYGLFSRKLKPFYWKWLYKDREMPMRLWTYGGLGYYGGYLMSHRKGLWYIDDPGLNKVDHGLVLRFWNMFFFDDYDESGYISVGLFFNVYVGLQRVLDFKTYSVTTLMYWYPMHFRVSYVW